MHKTGRWWITGWLANFRAKAPTSSRSRPHLAAVALARGWPKLPWCLRRSPSPRSGSHGQRALAHGIPVDRAQRIHTEEQQMLVREAAVCQVVPAERGANA